jgi:hypothetical protein
VAWQSAWHALELLASRSLPSSSLLPALCESYSTFGVTQWPAGGTGAGGPGGPGGGVGAGVGGGGGGGGGEGGLGSDDFTTNSAESWGSCTGTNKRTYMLRRHNNQVRRIDYQLSYGWGHAVTHEHSG